MEEVWEGPDEGVEALVRRMRGPVLGSGDPGYSEVRSVWNGRIDRRPAWVARCECPGDVAAAVEFARERDVPLSVRGGGHHVSGHAVTDGGLTLDLSPMDGIVIDAGAETVRANEAEHPDLFWGLRGGGGNFGIVTSFELRLHETGPESGPGP